MYNLLMSPDIRQAILERIKIGRTREEIRDEFIRTGYSESDFDSFFTEITNENISKVDNFNGAKSVYSDKVEFPGYLWFFKQAFRQVSFSSPLAIRFAVYSLIFATLYLFFTLAVIFALGAAFSFGEGAHIYAYLTIFLVYFALLYLFFKSFLVFIYALLNRSELLKYSEYKQKFNSSNGLIILLSLGLFLSFFSGFFVFLDNNLLFKMLIFIFIQFSFFMTLIVAFFSAENKKLSLSLKSSLSLLVNNFIKIFIFFIFYTLLVYVSVLLFSIPLLGLYLYFYAYFIILFATVIFYEHLCKKNIDTTTKV